MSNSLASGPQDYIDVNAYAAFLKGESSEFCGRLVGNLDIALSVPDSSSTDLILEEAVQNLTAGQNAALQIEGQVAPNISVDSHRSEQQKSLLSIDPVLGQTRRAQFDPYSDNFSTQDRTANAIENPPIPIFEKVTLEEIHRRQQEQFYVLENRDLERKYTDLKVSYADLKERYAELKGVNAQIVKENTKLWKLVETLSNKPVKIMMNQENARSIDFNQANITGTGYNERDTYNTFSATERQSLADAAAEIHDLLEQLSRTYPTETILQKAELAQLVADKVYENKPLAKRLMSAGEAGLIGALPKLLNNHPLAVFFIEAVKDWKKS